MLEQELVGIQNGPGDIFHCGHIVVFAGEVGEAGLQLFGRRLAADSRQIQLADDFFVRSCPRPSVCGSDCSRPQLAVNERPVKELNRHAEVRIGRPLAGADALPLRLAEDFQKIVLGDIRRGQLGRFHACWETR